ncbi:MAG: hypothetical protein E6R04_07060 [Spirochaetes bacterium]|nr:MAG: hypothetical protein E6R04_07060 [Spirochaetota bacterium]
MRYGFWETTNEIQRAPTNKYVKMLKCICVCGTEKFVRVGDLKNGKSNNCGCKREGNKTHGLTQSRTYKSWASMKARCLNPKSRIYKWYGGRGIKICSRWMKFENFLKDLGERPIGKSLDRIDNNGPYSTDNCRWATIEEQHRNTSKNIFYKWNGQRLTLTDIAFQLGIGLTGRTMLHRRIRDQNKPLEQSIKEVLKSFGTKRRHS